MIKSKKYQYNRNKEKALKSWKNAGSSEKLEYFDKKVAGYRLIPST